MERNLRTLEELAAEAARFTESLRKSDAEATLVTLSGELGAGKTAFAQAVANALGVKETVTSPTFVLEKIYQLPNIWTYDVHIFQRLVHIDAYRLEKGKDLAPLGFDELMQDAGNLILLEWPEKVRDALPEPDARITLVANGDGSRTITYV